MATSFWLFMLVLGVLVGGCGSGVEQLGQRLQGSYRAQQSYHAGLEQYGARDYQAAIPLFRRALALEPTFDDAEAYLAWSYYHTGQYLLAAKHFRAALARQPRWEGLHDGLGWTRYRAKRYHLALESFH